jgi:hypothetical protein
MTSTMQFRTPSEFRLPSVTRLRMLSSLRFGRTQQSPRKGESVTS